MTMLRDARLKKALDSAPDWHPALSESISDAIKTEALRALQPVAALPAPGLLGRVKTWLFPSSNMPWNAALASVLLASFVTLLWRGEELPDVAPEAAAPTAGIERPVAVAPQDATPADAPKKPTESKAVAAPPVENKRASERAAGGASDQQAQSRDEARQRRASGAAELAVKAEQTKRAERDTPLPAVTLPAPTPSPAPLSAGVMAAAPAQPAAAAQPTPPAPAVAAAARARSQQMERAAAPALLADQAKPRPSAATVHGWTEARVRDGGRVDVLRRAAWPQLAEAVGQLVQAASGSDALANQPTLQLELLRGAESIGLLELADPWVRWTATGQPSLTGVADGALLLELRRVIGNAPAAPATQ